MLLLAVALLFTCTFTEGAGAAGDSYSAPRAAMVEDIAADVRATRDRIGRKALNPRVMEVMGKVPRHEFVSDSQKPYAYENRPLPIGYGQTISQPYIVALMTDLLDITEASVVLEVGTGSGYQAAILAECVKEVYSVEIIKELGEQARDRLNRLGYNNTRVRVADGYHGWKEHAPFDGIIVTAAGSHIPPPLIEQLKPGGKMVIPVGGPFMTQQLLLVEKGEDGTTRTRQILPVAFVPLTGGH
ncbi:MAG: protein-L-isoaspartate(D-aspartate) O-methyltransferase [Syntrophobacteraceae bacterium]|nr:protein-L-isoaspartate(D-aspartate) O-methyltransferase [Syntrophobacteraceae bacterium]